MPPPVTVRAVLFDLYGTLIDIHTVERKPKVWTAISRFLTYQDVWFNPKEFSTQFFARAKRQQQELPEEHAEIDIALVFREILNEAGYHDAGSLSVALAGIYRVLSMEKFMLFPDTIPALRRLHDHFKLGVVSDAQRAYFRTELTAAKLAPLVDVTVASGEYGFRKPDPRLFSIALERLGVPPDVAVYVGDSVERDICGARAAGMWAVLLDRTGELGSDMTGCFPHYTVRNLEELCSWLLPDY